MYQVQKDIQGVKCGLKVGISKVKAVRVIFRKHLNPSCDRALNEWAGGLSEVPGAFLSVI